MYKRTHLNFWITSLTQEQHERTCGYWYTVTTGATAHTAFTNKSALMRWLDDRNIQLVESLPETGTHSWQQATGTYHEMMYMDKDAFDAIEPLFVRRHMSNGEYTLAKFTEDSGVVTVHYLNPNVKERFVYNYRESRSMIDPYPLP